jgi:predicted unusual protein kinase regulating ubiquinone biosynthesis (AarF/ABC1/UbiB family)
LTAARLASIQRLASSIVAGEDLLVASADKPFRFPATFTFVVRSFTVLDGIGKSLNPRFDISEIAAPYARGLLLEARPQFKKLAEEFRKRASKQARVWTSCSLRCGVCLDRSSLMKGNQSRGT